MRSARELDALSERLSLLVRLGMRFSAEPDPERLLHMACQAAREVFGATSVTIEIVEPEQGTLQQVVTGGREPTSTHPEDPLLEAAVLRMPLASPAHTYGWMILSRTLAAGVFSADDERLAVMLAAQLALAYENACCFKAVQTAVRARDEFLSVAAHELKTPLTALLGYSQLLLNYLGSDRAIEPARLTRALQAFEQQSLRLSRLVARLLDVSSIEAGTLRLNCRLVDVAGLVRQVVATARTQADDHRIVEHVPGEALAVVDPVRLEQVMSSLVENALKYSARRTQIDVEVVAGTDSVELAVRDRGPGIPSARRARIFGRFYRAHADNHASGMGLGLYISHHIVELHGGRIRAEFPPEGGTHIVVDLPAKYRPIDTSGEALTRIGPGRRDE